MLNHLMNNCNNIYNTYLFVVLAFFLNDDLQHTMNTLYVLKPQRIIVLIMFYKLMSWWFKIYTISYYILWEVIYCKVTNTEPAFKHPNGFIMS